VQSGETLWSIASNYGVDPQILAADNEVPESGALAVGQTLVIRFPRLVHAVSSGDTLESVAADYGVSLRSLWQNNWYLRGSRELTPRQPLIIKTFSQPARTAQFNGYAYPQIDLSLLRAEASFLSYVIPFTYGISADGGLLPLDDEAMLDVIRGQGSRPVLHLSSYTENEQFDSNRAAKLLTDLAAQDRMTVQIEALIQEKGFAGVDVDFEFLPPALADSYAAFLARLRQRLGPQGYFVWAALAPKTSPDQPGLLYEGHKYDAVGEAVDAVLLMTYEWGYTYGPPMAVAPLPNVRAVLEYALTVISPSKIFLGIPNYGYDWPLPFQAGVTRAESISNRRAIELAVRYGVPISYDEEAQAPNFTYESEGVTHQVWFEDARSIAAKLDLIAQYGLRGGSLWNIDRPFSQTYLTIASQFRIY
jgi:spore germination protein